MIKSNWALRYICSRLHLDDFLIKMVTSDDSNQKFMPSFVTKSPNHIFPYNIEDDDMVTDDHLCFLENPDNKIK